MPPAAYYRSKEALYYFKLKILLIQQFVHIAQILHINILYIA